MPNFLFWSEEKFGDQPPFTSQPEKYVTGFIFQSVLKHTMCAK